MSDRRGWRHEKSGSQAAAEQGTARVGSLALAATPSRNFWVATLVAHCALQHVERIHGREIGAGFDALLATVQMPAGIPVATVAVGKAGARNAGILAVKILGSSDDAVAENLQKYQDSLKDKVLGTVDDIKAKHPNHFDL